MPSLDFCRRMPKVELHVHLEGAIAPETVLDLAKKNGVQLLQATQDGLKNGFHFRDFTHFVDEYVTISRCIATIDDLNRVLKEFVDRQKAENILHSDVTYTASTLEKYNSLAWEDQKAALNAAVAYATSEGVSLSFILDFVRGDSVEEAMKVATWATECDAVKALGLTGFESKPIDEYKPVFEFARSHGLPVIPHAGEEGDVTSIQAALKVCQPLRIAHGVKCLDDRKVMEELRDRFIPLDVTPTSNIALGVFPSLEEHPISRMLDEGLVVTIGSDDPALFRTTLSEEIFRCSEAFEFDEDILWSLTLNAVNSALIDDEPKRELVRKMRSEFTELQDEE